MTNSTATRYSVKYARGVNHIAGLDEVVNTGPNSLNYARSACPALSRSISWCTARPTDDLQAVLEAARSPHYGIGPCKKCEKTALAQIARELGCDNDWHASAPIRMTQKCAHCGPESR